MLNNDLSNRAAPILLFNFERVICEEFEKKLLGHKYVVNQQNIHAINQLFMKDFRILYLTFVWPDKKLDKLEDELDFEGCLFNGMIKVKDQHSLMEFLKHNLGSHYFDTDITLVKSLGQYASKWEGYLISLWGGNL